MKGDSTKADPAKGAEPTKKGKKPKSSTTTGTKAPPVIVAPPEKVTEPEKKEEPKKEPAPEEKKEEPKKEEPKEEPKKEEAKKEEPKPEQVAAVDTSKAGATIAKGKVDPFDWPHWRGPEQNGISRETGLVDRWSPDGENLLWQRPDIESHSTPIVMRGKLYTIARAEPRTTREGERVVCLDPATGKTIWENRFNVFLSDVPDTRVSWSSVVGDPETGNVYALGVCGLFLCLDGETGKTLWSRSLSEEFGMLTTYGGRTNFPVMHEDKVVISGVIIGWGDMAKPTHRFLAFDKNTGEAVYFNGTRPLPEDTTYSTPILGVLGGQSALVGGAGDGALYAFQPRTGKTIWKYDMSIRGLFNTPLIDGNTIYMGQSEENIDDTTMGSVVALNGVGAGDITKSKQNEIWRIKELTVGRSSPVLVNGKLYAAADGGKLLTLDAKTGETLASKSLGTIIRPSLVYADGKLYANEANGKCFIFKVNEDGTLKLSQMNRLMGPPDESGKTLGTEIHASPVISHGRLFIQTTDCLFCIGTPEHKVAGTPAPKAAEEDPLTDMTPAWVQVVPVEALFKPGDKAKYQARLFNARGQFLKVAEDAQFTADAGGKFEGATFNVEEGKGHRAAYITCKVGELTGTARARIVPPLPWKFDFEDGEIPISWIGARYRHIVRDVDGNKVMVKITTIPKGTRSQGWMGPTDLSNCTIQADVLGKTKDGKLPDIGVQTQRYRLEMMGSSQDLKLYSWISHEQKYKKVKFEWSPDVWYTMKFRAAVEKRDGKDVAVLKGKVWPREKPEPEAWTIEVVDETADTNGAPGLFGNASFAEIFYDNITVTPNE